jgi:plastocyanin
MNYTYMPADITVPVGTAIIWINEDMVDHTVTSDDPGIFDNYVPVGGSTSITFSIPGTYYYHCSIHTDMMGSVTVTG